MPVNFFDEVDSTGIVESHIKQVLKLEDTQAKSIMSDYKDIRRDLVDRISRYPRGKFTSQHLKGVLAQVNGAITAINEHLAGATVEGAYQAALQGVGNLLTELRKFDEKFTGAVTPINLNAALVARDTSNFLVTRYKTNLDDYGTDLLRQISNGLFSAAIGEVSYDEVVGRISNFFTADEWKLHRIVRTELHHVFNVGKLNGMRAMVGDVPDLYKTLMHPMDARTGQDSKFAASMHLIAEINKPFEYMWQDKLRSYMVPPDRPNDRSILVPYREEWGILKGAAFIPGSFPDA
jgi:hypothetical protein